MTMQIVNTIRETKDILAQARAEGKTVGLVPTMGYFHEGHLSLMRKAREENDVVVVSIFVNPIQFGPNEDLAKYPRDLDRDSKMAEGEGVDYIFHPSVDEMYSKAYNTYVDVEGITADLCGASRPGHFRGVSTVVLKLFNIVRPDRAYFGEKDFQQVKVIQRMVADLNLDVAVVAMPIVREADGLAMSSRNEYLNEEERHGALILSRALSYAKNLVSEGLSSPVELAFRIWEFIRDEPTAQIEYVQVVDGETLDTPAIIDTNSVLAIAIKIGNTRLIDNAYMKR